MGSLLRELEPVKSRLKDLGKKSATIECALIIECDQEPPLNFTVQAIQFLAEIGASLDIDQYIDPSSD